MKRRQLRLELLLDLRPRLILPQPDVALQSFDKGVECTVAAVFRALQGDDSSARFNVCPKNMDQSALSDARVSQKDDYRRFPLQRIVPRLFHRRHFGVAPDKRSKARRKSGVEASLGSELAKD